ncbi:hypothetical protein [Sorangium sp. So ce341]|uniref:hypothetical protein n=1 Tax=Sorangium sp. So ce341 TaxID=3133302 RepID=UPI003F60EF39
MSSMFSTTVSFPAMTQIALPPELVPAASIFARPPTPRSVSPSFDQPHRSPA